LKEVPEGLACTSYIGRKTPFPHVESLLVRTTPHKWAIESIEIVSQREQGPEEFHMPELVLKKTGHGSYRAETPSGTITFGGGSPSPMDTVAASLGACLAISISQTLGVMRQKLDDIEIRLSFERKEEEPKLFEYFNIHLILHGENLSPAKVEKALHMSEESYCPVSVILGLSGAQMRTTFAIENKTVG